MAHCNKLARTDILNALPFNILVSQNMMSDPTVKNWTTMLLRYCALMCEFRVNLFGFGGCELKYVSLVLSLLFVLRF